MSRFANSTFLEASASPVTWTIPIDVTQAPSYCCRRMYSSCQSAQAQPVPAAPLSDNEHTHVERAAFIDESNKAIQSCNMRQALKQKQKQILSTEEIGGTLGAYRIKDGKLSGRVRLGERHKALPHEIEVKKDHSKVYNTVFGNFDYASAAGDGSGYFIAVTDLKNLVLEDRLFLFEEGSTQCQRAPHGLKLNPSETELWVNCEYVNSITGSQQCLVKFDLTSGNKYPVEVYPFPSTLNATHNIMFSQDGRYLFLQASAQGMGVFDTVSKTFSVVFTPAVGNNIHGINPAGNNLILVTGADYAWILNVANPLNPVIVNQYGPFGVGQMIYSSATNDGKYILLPAPYAQQVLIVNRSTGAVVKRVIPDRNPTTVTITDDSKYAFISPGNGSYIYKIDLSSSLFPITKIFTETDAATNRIALVPEIAFNQPKEIHIAVVLPLSGPPPSQGTTYRPIGTVMCNTIGYWQELKNLQGGIYNGHSKRAYKVEITWFDDESSDSKRNALVSDALANSKFDFVLACHPDTSPLSVSHVSGKLIGYPYSASGTAVPYSSTNLSYNDWQSLPNLTNAIFDRYNVPVTNEQYTTIGVCTLLGNVIQQLPLNNTASLDLVGYKLYHFGMQLTLQANHDVTVGVPTL